ncbi:MAG: HAMP domain-containing sensor histidine kinase, partial [Ignavibacteria bacterium]|nr:HAMP domain-containing sensor histidine kinase [Ignavibacteria bacterium]
FSFGTSYFQLIILSITLIFSTFIIDLIVGDFKISIQDIKDKSYEITNANKELHHLNATKDKFFSIIAHDLRSPFQGLLGIANILESLDGELTREERKNFVSRLSIALKRQYDFLEELLLWGKIQRDSIDFEPELCNLTEIAERNGEILSGNIYKKKINFKIDGPAEVNARCDENLISTVIRNLISNAIKYTPTGGKVTVAVQDMNDNVIVKVIDTGIGFSEERKKQLFFIESNSSTRGTENEPGTGLGLILCQEIMAKHLGSISVISEEGKGSTFSIQLPKNIKIPLS